MKRTCVFASVAAVLLACTAPLYAQPERDALQMVPDDALGFVIVNRLGETNDKLGDMTKRMQIPLPLKPIDFIKLITGVQKGINEKGSVVAAAFDGPREGSEPAGILFIPVSDYKEFVEQLSAKDSSGAISEAKIGDKAILVAKKNGFALISPAEDRDTLARAMKSTKSVAGATIALDAWITQNDIAGVMTPRGLKVVTAIATKKLEEEKGKLDNLPPEAQFVVGMYDGIVNFVKGIGSDVRLAGIGGRIDASGNLHVDARAVFAKGSAFAKFGAASAKPGEGGPLAGLPSGPFAIAAGGVIAERTAHGLANLSVSMLKTIAKDLPAEKLQKLEQAYALSMKGMRGMGMLLQVGKEDEPLLASMVAVIRTDDATKYLADYEQSLKNINEVLKDLPLPFVPSYDLKTVKAGKLSALEMTMDLGALIPPDDEVRKMLDKAFGAGGKITASLAALDSKTVIMRYTPVAGLSEIIKTAKSKALAMDPEVVKTAALLPAGAQWALYVSPKGVTDLANRSLKLFGAPNEVPGFAATPPAAAGLKLSEGGIELRVVLPAAVLEQVGPYLGKLQTLRLQ